MATNFTEITVCGLAEFGMSSTPHPAPTKLRVMGVLSDTCKPESGDVQE